MKVVCVLFFLLAAVVLVSESTRGCPGARPENIRQFQRFQAAREMVVGSCLSGCGTECDSVRTCTKTRCMCTCARGVPGSLFRCIGACAKSQCVTPACQHCLQPCMKRVMDCKTSRCPRECPHDADIAASFKSQSCRGCLMNNCRAA
ncbi:vanadium-binding protein 3 [Ciona intestinalis]